MNGANELTNSLLARARRFAGAGGVLAAVAGLAIAAAPVSAQDYYENDNGDESTAWEWESEEGFHEEEWYDPSDWFDDEPYDDYGMDTINYENGDDYDDDYDDESTAWEWESEEGFHEEEWYDPSDWFDDEPYDDEGRSTIDYENRGEEANDWEWESDERAEEREWYDPAGWFDDERRDDDRRDADDDNGDSTNREWDRDEGFHEEEWYDPSDWFDDEPYDDEDMNTVDYEYGDDDDDDWWSDDWEIDDANRDRDRSRMRSDRGPNRMSDEAQERRMAAQQRRGLQRVRGVVDEVSRLRPSGMSDRLVYRIAFENGERGIFDFGARMSERDFPVEVDERVTIAGTPMERDGRRVIVVSTIIDDGEIYVLRNMGRAYERPQRQMQRQMQDRNERDRNRDWDDWNRDWNDDRNRNWDDAEDWDDARNRHWDDDRDRD